MNPRLKKTIILVALAFVAALGVRMFMARLANPADTPTDPNGVGNVAPEVDAGVTVETLPEDDTMGEDAAEEVTPEDGAMEEPDGMPEIDQPDQTMPTLESGAPTAVPEGESDDEGEGEK